MKLHNLTVRPAAEAFAALLELAGLDEPAGTGAITEEALGELSVTDLLHLTAGIPGGTDDSKAGRAVSALFRRWAETDPEKALPLIPPLGIRPGIEAATALAERLAALHPASAIQWVDKLSDIPPALHQDEDPFGDQLQALLEGLPQFGDFAMPAPDLMLTGNPVKHRAWDTLIRTLVSTDVEKAKDAFLRAVSSSGYASESGAEAIGRALGLMDPCGGFAFFERLPGHDAAAAAGVEAVALSWATVDFSAARKWVAKWDDEARNEAVSRMMEAQPEHCVELWRMLSDDAMENEARWYGVIRAFAACGAAGAADKLLQLKQNERWGSLMWEIFHRVAMTDDSGVRAQLNRELPADLLSGIATGLAFAVSDKNPQEAATLLRTFGASDDYPVTHTAGLLAALELPAALDLLSALLPDGPQRSAAVSEITRRLRA